MSTRLVAVASIRVNAIVALIGASLFCIVRMWRVGGLGAFVVAAEPYSSIDGVAGGIPVATVGGFDGQFFYRMALAPWRVEMTEFSGITLDYGVRGGRVGYPLLAWLLSFGGRPGLVAFALVAVNVLAISALAAVGGALARSYGRCEWWGLLLAGYWGFAIVVGRDLSEAVAALAVFGALLALAHRRWWMASVACTYAVLTREQAVLAVAALTIGVVLSVWRAGSRSSALRRGAQVALLPASVFIAWQSWVASVTGELPATASSDANSTLPFAAVGGAMRHWVDEARLAITGELGLGSILPLLCFAALVVLVGAAMSSDGVRRVWRERPWELLVGAAAVLVLVSSTGAVLDVPAEFRQSSEIAGTSWLVLFASTGRRIRVAAAVVVPITLMVILFRLAVL